jgi:hypothetical protein
VPQPAPVVAEPVVRDEFDAIVADLADVGSLALPAPEVHHHLHIHGPYSEQDMVAIRRALEDRQP